MGHKYFLCYGLAGAVPPTEETETPVTKQADRQETSVDVENSEGTLVVNPYPTAFPYGNGMVLHFYQQQESSTTKTVHKVINTGLKAYV